jgi:3-phytase
VQTNRAMSARMPPWIALVVLSNSACSEREKDSPHEPADAAFDVAARAETTPSEGDPDDTAIWVDPEDPSKSLIVGTDKSGGITLYELDGTLRQDLRDGVMNNVDLRNGVDLGGDWGIGTLIATSNRTDDTIDLYTLDPNMRMLVRLAAVPSDIGEPYGLCSYRSPVDGRVYVLIDDKLGAVAQYELLPGPTLMHRRTVMLGGQLEGCVADDELARLYVGEEDLGIWRLDAEPDADDEAILIHDLMDSHLTADVEGLTIYYAADGAGYLIASSQGSSTYVIFERGGENAYLTSFRIVEGSVDAAVESDGIEVTNLALGPMWPNGLFIAHDDHNEGFTRNFKLVDWGDLAAAADVELLVDPDFRVYD